MAYRALRVASPQPPASGNSSRLDRPLADLVTTSKWHVSTPVERFDLLYRSRGETGKRAAPTMLVQSECRIDLGRPPPLDLQSVI